jgi:chromate transporter
MVAGIPGACAGWLAMITPAFLIIPMLLFLGKRTEHRRVKSVTRTVLLAGAGLMAAAAAPLARDAITGPVTLSIVITSFVLIAVTRIDTLWIMLGAAIAGFLSFQL